MYVVNNFWGSEQYMYVFNNRADAEEFLFAIAEEFAYIQFCHTSPEDFFGSLKTYIDFNIDNKNISTVAASLMRAVDRYELKEAKYVL